MVCATVFGKDESSGGFEFDQQMVDHIVELHRDILTGTLVFTSPVLPMHFLQPLLHLCISDVNKAMLVQCPALIPAVLDALFLDPEHVRKDMDETVRARIQRDGAECFLQLALFEPGRELLEQHPEALDALRALVDGAALTEEARLSASSALAAVEGVAPGSAPAGDDKHIMMSCVSCLRARPPVHAVI